VRGLRTRPRQSPLLRSLAMDSGLLLASGVLADVPYNHITSAIIESAIEVHRHLGPGLLESSYLECLHSELSRRGLGFERQRAVPIVYKTITLHSSYRIDLIVENEIVVEVKSVDRSLSVHDAQVLTYLRLINAPTRLLINFNVPRLLDGLKRIINSRYVSPV
jgi:GxxExxY protein